MSHIVRAALQNGQPLITSLPAAKRATEMLGCVWVEEKQYRGFRGNIQGRDAAAVIRIPGSDYDVGVVPVEGYDGAFTLAYDPWEDHRNLAEKTVGPLSDGTPRFAMYYRMASDELVAAENGDTIEFEQLDDGSFISRLHTQARVGE